MSGITVYGFPRSTYTRTVLLTLAEKGVTYTLQPANLGTPEHAELHPFQKMPAFRHGEVSLYETTAIARYIDEAFDGPALQPADPAGRARMEQWLSVVNAYIYEPAIKGYVLELFRPSGPDGKPDQAKVDKGLATARERLKVIDQGLGAGPYLAGKTLSLADLLLAPIMDYVANAPAGEQVMAELPNLRGWLGRITERESYSATAPQAA